MSRRATGAVLGVVAGLAVAAAALGLADRLGLGRRAPARTQLRHVAEDASAPLSVIAIHYAPAADPVALDVWRQLFAVLPAPVRVEVAVANAGDFDRFMGRLRGFGTPHLERFHAVAIGEEITTWSRDRFAAQVGPDGRGGVLAPPRIETAFAGRAGDWKSPFALSMAVFEERAVIADFVFEGGDLASTPRWLFVDANLSGRNVGRAEAGRARLEAELRRHFAQEIVWLGDEPGDVPRHHIMMYMVPIDDETVAVGDVREGAALLRGEPAAPGLDVDPDEATHARRFDRAAELLAARGFRVVRFPVVVLRGAASYVTYTNALFDRAADGRRVVYLPTYRLPALDGAARRRWEELGYEVRPIDVQPIYRFNGSLGCLVNVMARGATAGP